MTFDERVKFLRALPQFKVIPISEVRAISFAAKETGEEDSLKLGQLGLISLFLNKADIEKITRAYPDLALKLV